MLYHQTDKVGIVKAVESLQNGKDVEKFVNLCLVSGAIKGWVFDSLQTLRVELS